MSRVIGNITTTAILDGDVAFNVNQQGAPRPTAAAAIPDRNANHPIALVRLALDPSTTVTNPRTEGKAQLVDITPKQGPRYTLAIDAKSGLPLWARSTENQETLRDLTSQKWFTGFEPINGIMMPTGFKTTIDFRNGIQSQIYVTRNSVDGPIDDLSAPAAVKSAAPPTPPTYVVEAEPVTKGIWLLHGNTGHNSILIEFADHLTMFEVPLRGVDESPHRQSPRHRPRQTRNAGDRLPPPLRSQRRRPHRHRRRPDHHRPPWHRRPFPGSSRPQIHPRAGRASPHSQVP